MNEFYSLSETMTQHQLAEKFSISKYQAYMLVKDKPSWINQNLKDEPVNLKFETQIEFEGTSEAVDKTKEDLI